MIPIFNPTNSRACRLLASLPLALSTLLLVLPLRLAGQEVPADSTGTPSGELRVFLDCATHGCDRDRFRREITFVEWVRDPQDAQLHVIMTGQQAGGGFRYSLDFIGRGPLEGLTDSYGYSSSATDVEEETSAGLTRVLRLGLVRFVALSGLDAGVRVEGVSGESAPGEAPVQRPPEEDPWDYWVFSTRLGAELDREDQVRSDEFSLNLSANRTTEEWKVDFGFYGSSQTREYDLNDSTTYVNKTDDWSGSTLVVRSLSDHWSMGGSSRVGTSTRYNRRLSVEFTPAVEWNYFPWQDASRRRLVVLYGNGVEWVEYDERTIFDKKRETLWRHHVDVEYRAQEPWGNARVGVEGNQILSDPGKYSFEFDGDLEYRLTRGLSLSIGGSYEIIRDQIYLSAAGLSDEDKLTQRRQLQTGSRLSIDLGVSYRFGSIFNSIVNSRFPSVR